MVRTRQATAMTNKATAQTATAANSSSLSRVYVSDIIAPQTLAAGTFKGTIRCLESAVNDNVDAVRSGVYVFSADGTRLLGTLSAIGNRGPVAEFNTALRNKRIADGDATSALTIGELGRIVIELGFTNTTIGTSVNATLNYGDNSATDCADNETGTAADNPFVELSIDVVFAADLVYRNAILGTPGLVGYWRLGEISGTNANDETPNNRDGTYTGGFVLAAEGSLIGDSDYGCALNGTTGYVTIADNDAWSLTTTGELSIECWCRPTNATDGDRTLVAKGTASNYEWQLFRDTDQFYAVVYEAGGASRVVITANVTVLAGVNAYVALTLDNVAEVAKIYVDGALIATNPTWTGTSTNGTSPVNIGRRPDNVQFYNGDVDEVAIYDRVLTDDEVLTHYNFGRGRFPFNPRVAVLQAVNRAATF
jgi:hypothetical protein